MIILLELQHFRFSAARHLQPYIQWNSLPQYMVGQMHEAMKQHFKGDAWWRHIMETISVLQAPL